MFLNLNNGDFYNLRQIRQVRSEVTDRKITTQVVWASGTVSYLYDAEALELITQLEKLALEPATVPWEAGNQPPDEPSDA